VQSSADRYTYVPLVGVFLMLAWGLPELLPARRFTSALLGAAAALAVAAARSGVAAGRHLA